MTEPTRRASVRRLVEEAYRGEPQTRILAGLRFYQWIAILSVLAGAKLKLLWQAHAAL